MAEERRRGSSVSDEEKYTRRKLKLPVTLLTLPTLPPYPAVLFCVNVESVGKT